MIECGSCGQPFEPVRTRWLCPACKHKESCCEGEALPAQLQAAQLQTAQPQPAATT